MKPPLSARWVKYITRGPRSSWPPILALLTAVVAFGTGGAILGWLMPFPSGSDPNLHLGGMFVMMGFFQLALALVLWERDGVRWILDNNQAEIKRLNALVDPPAAPEG